MNSKNIMIHPATSPYYAKGGPKIMKFINAEQTTDMMISVCQSIIKNKPYLTEVDSKLVMATMV